jgi:tetratricopeptide (TPR) repeat protein
VTESWRPRRALEGVLAEAAAYTEAQPDAPEGWFLLGRVHHDLGDEAAAAAAFREVLERDPAHFGALTSLALATAAEGRSREALELFEIALEVEPQHPVALVNVANAVALEDPERAEGLYHAALEADPSCEEAHQGLTALYALLGDVERAARHRERGFRRKPVVRLPYYGNAEPIPALLLASTDGGNVDVGPLLDRHVFQTHKLYVEAYRPALGLPPHALIVNGIADPDRGRAALERATELFLSSRVPLLNEPAAVLATERHANAARLAGVPGTIVPESARLTRDALLRAQGLHFPLLLRAPGFHQGRHFLRVDRDADLANAVAQLPGDEILAMGFVDLAAPDGTVRKFRAMAIGGELYPLHLAIGEGWNVQYDSAAMAEHPDRRAEEAFFLADMPAAIGAAAMAALTRIVELLGLDYAGIDFGLTRAGELVVFEANAAMAVIAPDDDARWDYRRKATARIHAAMRALAVGRSEPGERRTPVV